MRILGAVLSVLLVHSAAGSDDYYEVPEPVFDVYSPKGLRISLPDSRNVQSVEFFVNLPTCPEPLIREVNHTTNGRWVFWNPDAALRLHDKLRYKLMVQRNGVYWKKEGTHAVQKVSPLANDTDCPEAQGQRLIAPLPALAALEDRDRPLLAASKAASFKSSYSTQKTSDLKPITKSSISTTSGTFFIKPSGVMEATGFKKASSFDSSRREGEQWQHHQSELTAEELENMKNLYGSGLRDFPLFPPAPTAYEKRFMSSESHSFPPLAAHNFQQTHQTHQTSTFTRSNHFADAADARPDAFRPIEPLAALPDPLPPQGTIFKATEYVRQEHTLPAGGRTPAPQKIVQAGEFASQRQEVVRPVFEGRGDQAEEHRAGSVRTVEREGGGGGRYVGNIFTSVRRSRVRTPEECGVVAGVDYVGTGSVREVERQVQELSCLATLAESTMKEEVALLKQRNSELSRKLEQLEHEVKRISGTCNCY